MKLLLFLQLEDLVRAVLNPPDCCPGYVQNVLGHSLGHMDMADGAGHAGAVLESPGGWQEPDFNSNALSQDALTRKEWNEATGCVQPPGTGFSAPARAQS